MNQHRSSTAAKHLTVKTTGESEKLPFCLQIKRFLEISRKLRLNFRGNYYMQILLSAADLSTSKTLEAVVFLRS